MVGAPQHNGGTVSSGIVYQPPGALVAVLREGPPQVSRGFFGSAVALSGSRLVVGAPGQGSNGAAYVYDLSSATPTVPAVVLQQPSPGAADYFGSSVAISGDHVLVSAIVRNQGAGAVYIYNLGGANLSRAVQTWNNPATAAYANFGRALALSGDLAVVGVSQAFVGGITTGAASVFRIGNPAPIHVLNNPTPAAADAFGHAVAIAGNRVVVGAIFDDTSVENAGSAYLYDLGSATPNQPVLTLNNPRNEAFERFGEALAIAGNRLIVSTLPDTFETDPSAPVYIYDLASATPAVPIATVHDPTPGNGSVFAFALAISGTRLLVSDLFTQIGVANTVHIFDLAITSSAPQLTLSEATAGPDDVPCGVLQPEIRVEQPAGTVLADGAANVSFGGILLGSSASRTFAIGNLGSAELSGIVVTLEGAQSGDFVLSTAPASSLAPNGSTSFVVTFSPGAVGARNATLRIASNDADENPFDIALTGVGAAAGDTDGDGLSDLDEANVHRTDPTLADTDGDLVGDGI